MMPSPPVLLSVAAAALLLAACSGDAPTTTTTQASPTPRAAAAASEPAPSQPTTDADSAPAESTTDQEEAITEPDDEPTEDASEGGGSSGDSMAATDFDAIFSGQIEPPDMEVPDEETEEPASGSSTPADSSAGETTSGTSAGGSSESYGSYTVVTDDTGTITVAIPEAWSDVDGAPIEEGGVTIYDVRASSDLSAFQSSWTTPGVIVTAVSDPPPAVTVEGVLDEVQAELGDDCESVEERQPYSDALYTGVFDVYSGCGAEGATYVAVGAEPADQSSVIRVQVQVNAERDLEALDAVLQSFEFTG